MEKFLQGFSEKKILGVRCPKCNRVLLPPRSSCGQCWTRPEEWVEMETTGTLENYTVGHVTVEKGEIRDLQEPEILGMIKLDGADSLIMSKIRGIPPDACRTGIRVRAVWKDETKGHPSDLDSFEPAEGAR
jgi:uncharacterized OB-fold protein